MNALVASYHSAEFDASKCVGRRGHSSKADRHWSTFVLPASQCKNAPVSGFDLCSTCQRHWDAAAAAGDPMLIGASHDWNGRVTDTNLDSLPANSHIAGSPWFHRGRADGSLVWREQETPRTARMAAGHKRKHPVTDLELTKFLRGEAAHLDIEELSGHAMQISGQQLRNMLCMLYGKPLGADGSGKFGTKPKMCAEIRRMMVAGAVPDPRFHPTYPKAAAALAGGGGAAAPAPAGGGGGAAAAAPAQLPPEGAAAGPLGLATLSLAAASPAEAAEAEAEEAEAEPEPEPVLIHVGPLLAEAEARADAAEAELAAVKAELLALKAQIATLIA